MSSREKVLNSSSGMTLIEMLVSVALLAVIILAALSTLDFGSKSFEMIDDRGELQSKTFYIEDFISKKIRSSKAAVVVANDLLVKLEITGGNSHSSSIEWDRLNTLKYINHTTGESIILSENVTKVVFNGLAGGVEMEVELTRGDQSLTFKTRIYSKL